MKRVYSSDNDSSDNDDSDDQLLSSDELNSDDEPLSSYDLLSSDDSDDEPSVEKAQTPIKRQKVEGKQTRARDDANDTFTLTLPTKLFDCSRCSKRLQPPLFQCIIGDHIVCSQCYKDGEKCPVCKYTTRELFCPLLKSIMSYIKVPCKYAIFGCKESVPLPLKRSHEDSCPSAPCVCPIKDCKFQGSPQKLIPHIQSKHQSTKLARFRYNIPSRISLHQKEPFYVLHNTFNDGLFLLFNGRDFPSGSSLSMVCIRTVDGNYNYQYELKVEADKENFLQMKATLPSSREWKGGYPTKQFLFIPSELSGKSGAIDVDVLISRKSSCIK